jgi:biopolymer transport protein ExbD
MITRPLDLAEKLRPEPRSFDWLFFVNAGLIVLFFSLFGSRFVLAPGFGLMELPAIAGANANARPTTHYITVVGPGQVIAGDGLRDREQLRVWLEVQAKTTSEPTLLVLANRDVSMSVLADIVSVAQAAGFHIQVAATEGAAGAKQASH